MPKVFKIGVTKNNNQAIQEVKEINLLAGKGIIGDRHFHEHSEDRNQLTLIESENIDFYNENAELLRHAEREWHAGTDQTPVNFLIHDRDVDFKWLPYEFNMCDMFRKELLTDDLLFTKWGWIYQYNSIPYTGTLVYQYASILV